MSRIQKFNSILTLLLSILILVISSVTYAWIININQVPGTEGTTGGFDVIVIAGPGISVPQEVEKTFALNTLAYIDFEKDFVLDETKTLNQMATSINLTFRSTEINTNIHLSSFLYEVKALNDVNNSNGLVFALINCGVGQQFVSNYRSWILPSMPANTIASDWRQSLKEYNDKTLDEIMATYITRSQIYRFQLVFWGDYDKLATTANYLTEKYMISVKLSVSQYVPPVTFNFIEKKKDSEF